MKYKTVKISKEQGNINHLSRGPYLNHKKLKMGYSMNETLKPVSSAGDTFKSISNCFTFNNVFNNFTCKHLNPYSHDMWPRSQSEASISMFPQQ